MISYPRYVVVHTDGDPARAECTEDADDLDENRALGGRPLISGGIHGRKDNKMPNLISYEVTSPEDFIARLKVEADGEVHDVYADGGDLSSDTLEIETGSQVQRWLRDRVDEIREQSEAEGLDEQLDGEPP
jgi:hypothetical protein